MLWENEPQHKMGMPPSGHLALQLCTEPIIIVYLSDTLQYMKLALHIWPNYMFWAAAVPRPGIILMVINPLNLTLRCWVPSKGGIGSHFSQSLLWLGSNPRPPCLRADTLNHHGLWAAISTVIVSGCWRALKIYSNGNYEHLSPTVIPWQIPRKYENKFPTIQKVP